MRNRYGARLYKKGMCRGMYIAGYSARKKMRRRRRRRRR